MTGVYMTLRKLGFGPWDAFRGSLVGAWYAYRPDTFQWCILIVSTAILAVHGWAWWAWWCIASLIYILAANALHVRWVFRRELRRDVQAYDESGHVNTEAAEAIAVAACFVSLVWAVVRIVTEFHR